MYANNRVELCLIFGLALCTPYMYIVCAVLCTPSVQLFCT